MHRLNIVDANVHTGKKIPLSLLATAVTIKNCHIEIILISRAVDGQKMLIFFFSMKKKKKKRNVPTH